VHVLWDDAMTAYDFGPGHPLAPVRLDLTMRLARELGVLDHEVVTVTGAPQADERTIELVHTPELVAAVRAAGADPRATSLAHGLGTGDVPTFAGMHEASAAVVGASVAGAEAVWDGRAEHAVNISGGLHHAMADTASGFCVYNDVAVAIKRLLELGAERVAYVDTDVHHGDGVQAAFWADPRVLTISLHETGRALFPGTGFAEETGGPGAEGYAVNVALPPGTGDAGWLRAFAAVVPPLLRAYRPQVLVSQHGCDSHALDPLAHLRLSVDGQRAGHAALHRLAHETAAGRWLATGGGGYEVVAVVPRTWTHLLAEAAARPLDPGTDVPRPWREHVARRLGRGTPALMTDGEAPSGDPLVSPEAYDPADPLDRSVLASRRAVFDRHNLDPEPPATLDR